MTTAGLKVVSALTIDDCARFGVWQFGRCDSNGECMIRPVKRTPVENVNGKLFAIEAVLANGSRCWALIGNVNLVKPSDNEHFLTISLERDGKWFDLSRYHDVDYKRNGPERLAAFMGLETKDIFPISYDFSHLVKQKSSACKGNYQLEPSRRLTEEELILLALG